jgi:uncharacterized protein YhaN
MRLTVYFVLLLGGTASAQTASEDSKVSQSMLIEVRQLRQDLQTAAATIQRVQIVMYRLQVEASQLDRATQRMDQARNECTQAQWQRKMISSQIEQADARRRNSQGALDKNAAEEQLSQLRSSSEQSASLEQQCQIDQADAQTQLQAEQAKMNDLQDQLDRLDKVLAAYGRK